MLRRQQPGVGGRGTGGWWRGGGAGVSLYFITAQIPRQLLHPDCALPSPADGLGLLGRGRNGGGCAAPTGTNAAAVRPLCKCPRRSMCEINLEAELFTLQDSNAKLVAALQEANSSVEQWKKQLAEYQEETDRLRDQVRPGRRPAAPHLVVSQRISDCRCICLHLI